MALKTDWTALTRVQLVAALARKGFDRADIRAGADLAYAQGYANVDSTDGSTRVLIRYGHTEVDAWDAHTFALPVGKVRVPAETLTVGSVFYLVGSNGVGKYRVTSVRHTQFPGRVSVAVDWQSADTGEEWRGGGKGWNAGDMVTIDAQDTPATSYTSNTTDVVSGPDARHEMYAAHTIATPRMKPVQRDTRYPAGSWVWDHQRYAYAQVLRTPDVREASLVLYVPPTTGVDDEGYDTGVIVAPARTYLAPRDHVFPGANVGSPLSDLGAAYVAYARRDVLICEACGASIYAGCHDCQAPGHNIARAGVLGDPETPRKPFTIGAMRDVLGATLAARYVPGNLADDAVIPAGHEVTPAGIVPQVPTDAPRTDIDELSRLIDGDPWGTRPAPVEIELTPAYVCEPCAYAINYAEWPGDWSETDVSERDAQVNAYAGDVHFVVDIDGVDTLRDDTCSYHGKRFVGTMYPVSRTRIAQGH